MPSKDVEIKNIWHKEYTETYKGKEISIPAGKSIRMPRYEAVGFMGTCKGYVKWDGAPEDYPYAKALVMTDIPESGEINVKEEFISPKTGEKFVSQAALDAHLGYIAIQDKKDSNLAQALIDAVSKLGNLNKPTTEPSANKVYACSRCDYETPDKTALIKHSATHGNNSRNPLS